MVMSEQAETEKGQTGRTARTLPTADIQKEVNGAGDIVMEQLIYIDVPMVKRRLMGKAQIKFD